MGSCRSARVPGIPANRTPRTAIKRSRLGPVPRASSAPSSPPDPHAPPSFGMVVTTPPFFWGRCDNHPIAETAELIPDVSIVTRTGHDHGPRPECLNVKSRQKRYITGWHHAAGWQWGAVPRPGRHPRRPPVPFPPAAMILTSGKRPEIRRHGLLKFLNGVAEEWGRCDNHPNAEAAELIPDTNVTDAGGPGVI
jgi:hypothetical protein